jgi:hypothetical protein
MQHLKSDQLSVVHGGDGEATAAESAGPVRDENTGRCGLGPWSFGQTEECRRHDDCVGVWDQRVGRPASDVVCSPLLLDAARSAVRCAVNPYCPK